MPTTAAEVTFGMMMPIRKNVLARSCLLSRLARNSASISCGTVDTTKMPKVLYTAFQNW